VFLPACREIEHAGLRRLFGGMSSADIFATILHFYRAFDSGFPTLPAAVDRCFKAGA
jgi:hypothetical protein